MPVLQGPRRMPAWCIHGEAWDNTDDPGAMIRGAICECVKAPLGIRRENSFHNVLEVIAMQRKAFILLLS